MPNKYRCQASRDTQHSGTSGEFLGLWHTSGWPPVTCYRMSGPESCAESGWTLGCHSRRPHQSRWAMGRSPRVWDRPLSDACSDQVNPTLGPQLIRPDVERLLLWTAFSGKGVATSECCRPRVRGTQMSPHSGLPEAVPVATPQGRERERREKTASWSAPLTTREVSLLSVICLTLSGFLLSSHLKCLVRKYGCTNKSVN